MPTLLTGATGFLGAYVARELLERGEPFGVLVRARDQAHAVEKLWRAWQAHLPAERFADAMDRVERFLGDLSEPRLGLSERAWSSLSERYDAVVHVAATLSRRSERACLKVNVRGTLHVLDLCAAMASSGRFRRLLYVSTVAVAGERQSETVVEDEAVDWDRRDYDPYGRSKKLTEYLVRRESPMTIEGRTTTKAPGGSSRRPEVTQFDMIRAMATLAELPVVPVPAWSRQDIVPVDWVARAITRLHLAERPRWDTYHLSSGRRSPTAEAIAAALGARSVLGTRPRFAPALEAPFERSVGWVARRRRRNVVTGVASLLDVFLPYITYDTVFDNTRIVTELGEPPPSFLGYGPSTYRWARARRFRYPYEPMPASLRQQLPRWTGEASASADLPEVTAP